MTGGKGNLTVDEGKETPVFCALLPANTDIRGKFLADKKLFDWEDLEWSMPK
jgi:carbonyl reductase 1